MSVKLMIGDAREQMKAIESSSIDCVVTSPPYFNLRDYGTGTWEGGDSDCDHRPSKEQREKRERGKLQGGTATINAADIARAFCPRCGARRIDDQVGMEESPSEYLESLLNIFDEAFRVLKPGGTVWVNLGDSYNAYNGNRGESTSLSAKTNDHHVRRPRGFGLCAKTLPQKCLMGMPWRFALGMIECGWILRSDIIWNKPNPIPESVKDRPTKAHEYLFMFTKSQRYFYDADAIAEPFQTDEKERYEERAKAIGRGQQGWAHARGNDRDQSGGFPAPESGKRNRRTVWTITTKPNPEAHFATFPPELPSLCIRAGCPEGGTVLDMFAGSGTTGEVASGIGRNAVLIELSPEYAEIIRKRIGLFLES